MLLHIVLDTELLYHLQMFAYCVFVLMQILLGTEFIVFGMLFLRHYFANL